MIAFLEASFIVKAKRCANFHQHSEFNRDKIMDSCDDDLSCRDIATKRHRNPNGTVDCSVVERHSEQVEHEERRVQVVGEEHNRNAKFFVLDFSF